MQCSFLGWGNHLEYTLLLGWWRGGHRWISKTLEQLCANLNAEVIPSLVYFIWAVWWILEIFMQTCMLLLHEDKVLETFPVSIWWGSFPSVAPCCGQSLTQNCQASHVESLLVLHLAAPPDSHLYLPRDPLDGSVRCGQSRCGTELWHRQGKVLQTQLSQGQLGVTGLSCSAAWHKGPAHSSTRSCRALFIFTWKC